MKPKQRNKIKNGADSYRDNRCPDCGKPSARRGLCQACERVRLSVESFRR